MKSASNPSRYQDKKPSASYLDLINIAYILNEFFNIFLSEHFYYFICTLLYQELNEK